MSILLTIACGLLQVINKMQKFLWTNSTPVFIYRGKFYASRDLYAAKSNVAEQSNSSDEAFRHLLGMSLRRFARNQENTAGTPSPFKK